MDDTKNALNEEYCACCCSEGTEKRTQRSDDERRRLITRLNRVEGQITGLRKMVEKDAYCIDILTQSAAVRGAIDAFNRELLERHIKGCVVRDIRAGEDATVDELMTILGRLIK